PTGRAPTWLDDFRVVRRGSFGQSDVLWIRGSYTDGGTAYVGNIMYTSADELGKHQRLYFAQVAADLLTSATIQALDDITTDGNAVDSDVAAIAAFHSETKNSQGNLAKTTKALVRRS